MRCRRQSTGEFLSFQAATVIGRGGEAVIHSLPHDPALLAKLYHQPTDARTRKLAAMLDNPPDDPMTAQGHPSIAWPVDLLLPEYGSRVAGFLMPRVTGVHPIIDFYNPRTRRRVCPLFNYRYLHRAARNLAAAVRALHARGIVIGDVNESNVLIAERALVTLVDTDSFQVPDPRTGAPHRCPTWKPEFTPPELQRMPIGLLDRRREHDCFGLAVLIFHLLMEGMHPFAGLYRGAGDPPPYEARIEAGHFPFGTCRTPYLRPPSALPFETLAPALRALFLQCFEQGHTQPILRPAPETWRDALEQAERDLHPCRANAQHVFGAHLSACPWCQRAAVLAGRDPFPSVADATRPPPAIPRPSRSRTARPRPAPPSLVPSRRPRRPVPPPKPAPSGWGRFIPIALIMAFIGVTRACDSSSRRTPPSAPPVAVRLPNRIPASRDWPPKSFIPGPSLAELAKTPDRKQKTLPAESGDIEAARLRQAQAAAALGKPVKTSIDLGNAVSLDLVLIPAGSFPMGSDKLGSGERPVRRVDIAKPFYMGKYEVTQEQWRAAMGPRAGRFQGTNYPVNGVSWDDCQEFVRKLSERTKRSFSLPSEAEWEYACRAGTATEFYFGDRPEPDIWASAWYVGNSGGQPHPVGAKEPNAWGLYDMHGNVWEWCGGPAPTGQSWPGSGGQAVLRGGSYCNDALDCRSARRYIDRQGFDWAYYGCRVVLRDF